ncbi:MAG: ATP-binding protein [Deltaproteobacteria bacterium]|nr:ATP-binding protein [Deltaproteobacteria bacterium]
MRSQDSGLPFNPFATNAVGDPRREAHLPDVRTVNEKVSSHLVNLLHQIGRTPVLAALVLGEAGFGKTHLVRRLISEQDRNFVFAYVHPMKDYHRMYSTLLATVTKTLAGPVSGYPEAAGLTHFHLMAARIIKAAFMDYIKGRRPGQAVTRLLTEADGTPLILLKLQDITGQWAGLLSETEEFITRRQLLDNRISHLTLRSLLYLVDKSKRTAGRMFLSGEIPNDDHCRVLGLTIRDGDLTLEAQEARAGEILKTIGRLLAWYHPLILCFDQLENLDTDKLVKGFGLLVNDLVNQTENILPIGFVRPDTWNNVFTALLDRAPLERLKSNVYVLQGCNLDQALDIVRHRLDWAFQGARPAGADDFYPIDRQALEEAIGHRSLSPREVITIANRLMTSSRPVIQTPTLQPADPLEVLRSSFQAEKEQLLASGLAAPLPKEPVVAGLKLYFSLQGDGAVYLVEEPTDTGPVDLRIKFSFPGYAGERYADFLIETAVNWRPLQASFKMLTDRLRKGTTDHAFFIRDARHPIPPQPGTMPKTVEALKVYEQLGGHTVYLNPEAPAELMALVYTADKIGSQDLASPTGPAGHREPLNQEVLTRFVREDFRCRFLMELENYLGPENHVPDEEPEAVGVKNVPTLPA